MTKLDLKKEMRFLYHATRSPQLVQVPPLNILAIDGQGNPNTSIGYQQAVEALYSVSYTLKFMHKQRLDSHDYTVLPLEAHWWVPDMTKFSLQDKDAWCWTVMIVQPDFITEDDFELAKEQLQKKGKDLPALPFMRLERFEEGAAAQVLHLGPYDTEGPTIKSLHEFISEQGLTLSGKHHEIYLSDPRRTAPEKLKTIIRQPVCK
jgi:hypothetical protein